MNKIYCKDKNNAYHLFIKISKISMLIILWIIMGLHFLFLDNIISIIKYKIWYSGTWVFQGSQDELSTFNKMKLEEYEKYINAKNKTRFKFNEEDFIMSSFFIRESIFKSNGYVLLSSNLAYINSKNNMPSYTYFYILSGGLGNILLSTYPCGTIEWQNKDNTLINVYNGMTYKRISKDIEFKKQLKY